MVHNPKVGGCDVISRRMFTLSEYQQKASEALVSLYGREAKAIVKLWFESRLNMSRIDLALRRGESGIPWVRRI